MPVFGNAYSDAEIAAVANFVTDRFGGVSSNVTAADVGKLRQAE
jgi:mono/diheme cytochrome c family protein